jgi:hypothetical protein
VHDYLHINGKITATSGSIGNFQVYGLEDIPTNATREIGVFGAIDTTHNYGIVFDARPSILANDQKRVFGIGKFDDNPFKNWDDLNFYVRSDGYLYSSAGSIGGWSINKNSLSYTTTNTNGGTDSIALYSAD